MLTTTQTTLPVFQNECLEIKKVYENGENYLHFKLEGKFTANSCKKGYETWRKVNMNNPGKTFVHVWDCSSMTGFEQEAKKMWMRAMDEMCDQMTEVWLIADNILIRGAARLMSKFTKHELKAFKNTNETASWITA